MSCGSSSAPPHSWPKYGPVPLSRCPDCPRIEPLVRLTCKKRDTGNYGREFVKCESRPQPGKILKQCSYFCLLDAYIEKLQVEGGAMDWRAVADTDFTWELGAGAEHQWLPSNQIPNQMGLPGASAGEFAAELKKLNSKMRDLVELKKQQNMHLVFFVFVVVLAVLSVVFKWGK